MWTDDPRSRVSIGTVTVTRLVHPSEAHGAHRIDYPDRSVFVWPDQHSALYHARLIRSVLKACEGPEHLIGRLTMEGCECATVKADGVNPAETSGV